VSAPCWEQKWRFRASHLAKLPFRATNESPDYSYWLQIKEGTHAMLQWEHTSGLDRGRPRAVPARLGLEAPALAWPEGALALSTLGPSQSHWNGLALAWPGFRPRLSKAVTPGLAPSLAPALAACPALTMLHCHLLSGLRNNERGKTQRQKGYFVSSYCRRRCK
jgi:hypothetical protein